MNSSTELSRLELIAESHRRDDAPAESDISGFAQPAFPTPALQLEHEKAEPTASESLVLEPRKGFLENYSVVLDWTATVNYFPVQNCASE